MRRMSWLVGGMLAGSLAWSLTRQTRPVDLEDKVVVITGASSGIGRAAAHAFAAEGAHVVLVARRAALLEAVRAEIGVYGVKALAVPGDVTLEADPPRIITAAVQTFGRVDVLVNNAGVSYGGPFAALDPDVIRQMAAVNLYGPLRMVQAAVDVMRRQMPDADGVRGHIVNVSSVAGAVYAPGMAAYGGTRRGIIQFTRALRHELAGQGLRVSLVLPSWTMTPMAEAVSADAMRAAGGLWPGGGFDDPELIAQSLVDTVRFNRRRVVHGGPQFRLGMLGEWLTPGLVDLYWRAVGDSAGYAAAMRDLSHS